MAPLKVSDRFSLPARVLAQLVDPWVLIMFPRERANEVSRNQWNSVANLNFHPSPTRLENLTRTNILKVVFRENRCNRGNCPLTARKRTNKQIDPTRGVNTEMLAYEQALRDAMAAGREKEGELATTYVSRI